MVGDYYVWINTLKTIIATEDASSLIPIPDLMHVSLNAQEAVVRHAFPLFERLWSAAFPLGKFTPIRIRPIRRIALLRLMLVGWKRARWRVLEKLKLRKGLGVKEVVFFSMLWVFEEAIPLVLDAPALLASGDIDSTIKVSLCRC